MVSAEPRRLPVAIFLMKRGTSMWVGQAAVQGASKQNRQRLASTTAACGSKAGWRSGKLFDGLPRESPARLRPRRTAADSRPALLSSMPDELVHVGAADVHGRRDAQHVAVHAALADQHAVLARGFQQLRGLRRRPGALVLRSSTSSMACSRPMPRTSPMISCLSLQFLAGCRAGRRRFPRSWPSRFCSSM